MWLATAFHKCDPLDWKASRHHLCPVVYHLNIRIVTIRELFIASSDLPVCLHLRSTTLYLVFFFRVKSVIYFVTLSLTQSERLSTTKYDSNCISILSQNFTKSRDKSHLGEYFSLGFSTFPGVKLCALPGLKTWRKILEPIMPTRSKRRNLIRVITSYWIQEILDGGNQR